MKKFKWLALVIVVVLSLSIVLAACNKKPAETEEKWGEWEQVAAATCTKAGLEKRESDKGNTETRAIAATGHTFANHVCSVCGESEFANESLAKYAELEYGVDYQSLYDTLGVEVRISDVIEKADGRAYIYVANDHVASSTTEGAVLTELGLDFLSMAMVFNTQVPAAGDWANKTQDDIYAEWWKLYIQRWNILLPEVPLYSNEYYDMYNKKLHGVTEHPTNPYWAPKDALIDWTSDDDKIILGSTTELGGRFRYPSFGVSSSNASDNAVNSLASGLGTITTNKEGGYQVDDQVVKSLERTLNEDGTLTFTIEIKDDLKFSDGSAITAKNYLVRALVFSSPVATEAARKDTKAGLSYVGYEDFAAYDGTNQGATVGNATANKAFSGYRLLGTYKFSVTIKAAYADYYYNLILAGFSPEYLPMWLGEGADIADDGNGAYISGNFYAKNGNSYVKAQHIYDSAMNTDTTYPYSGAYVVTGYDESTKTATLRKNTYYKGNYEGTKPSITTVVYKKLVADTQLADFTSGGVDVISGITGGNETNEAIALAKGADGTLGTDDDVATLTHYSRAGYGKIGFRSDLGPVQFAAVREAIALCLDRSDFASQFTGGYGGVVDGPYYTGAWMYQAVKDDIILNTYTKSVDAAKDLLAANGWIYNADGSAYNGTGVRYKKIAEEDMFEWDKEFASVDGSLTTVYDEENGCYYMPLVLNWYGTVNNDFTDLLVTEFQNGSAYAQAGFAIFNTKGDFMPMLDELYQGLYGVGLYVKPIYNCFNFASSFSSAAYDYSWALSIDPSIYDEGDNAYYLKDYADFYMLNE